jgi:hypothetical protein
VEVGGCNKRSTQQISTEALKAPPLARPSYPCASLSTLSAHASIHLQIARQYDGLFIFIPPRPTLHRLPSDSPHCVVQRCAQLAQHDGLESGEGFEADSVGHRGEAPKGIRPHCLNSQLAWSGGRGLDVRLKCPSVALPRCFS